MSGSEAASTPSLMWLVVPFLDPRRWLGTLFALVGIAASIFTAVVPSILIRRVFPPSVSTVPLHYRPLRTAPTLNAVPKSPLKLRKQLLVAPTPRLSTRRSRTDDDIPLRSGASSSVPLRRTSSTGCIHASSSSNMPRGHDVPSENYLSPTGSSIPNLEHVPFSALQQASFISPLNTMLPNPPMISPDNNSAASKHSGGLDLSASSESPSPSLSREQSQKSKISFHLPLPKPGGARRSITGTRSDIKGKKVEENVAFEDESHLSSVPLGSGSSSNASSSSSVQANDQSREPLQSHRKFLLFSKEFRFRREKNRNCSISLAHSTAPDETPVTTHRSRGVSWDGVRFPKVNPSSLPSPSSTDMANPPMLDPTNIPPARPGRSDPYKTHGVPVPGSERSVAFLKAERQMRKQRMRSSDSETPTGVTRSGTNPDVRRAETAEPDQFGVMPERSRRRNRGFSWCPSESSRVQQEGKPRKDKTKTRRSWQAVRPCSRDSAKDRAYNSDTVT